MKIAIIGLYYASNLGDAVICDCVLNWFQEEYKEAQIDLIDIEGHTAFPVQRMSSTLKLKMRQIKLSVESLLTVGGIKDTIYSWCKDKTQSRQDFYEEIGAQRYDLAVFAGGQMFMDWLSLDVWEFIQIFEKYHTPVLFNACGVGSTKSRRITEMMKSALTKDNVRWISSRDGVEKINRLYLNGEERAVRTYDPALWTSDVYKIARSTSKTIGLGVMYCDHIPYNTVIRFWCDTIGCLEKEGREWKMFCNGSIWDYKVGCDVLNKLGYDKKDKLLDYPKEPRELVSQIAGFNGMISFRLHSQIIAVSLGIPCVGIQWDDKLRYFYRSIGEEERCFSISNRAEEVVHGLFQAQEKGYDYTLIETEKIQGRNLVMDQAQKVLMNE